MDTHPHADGDLSELERRLGAWRPDGDGLDPAAMLFAAGQASARPGRARLVWPLLCGCLALVAASLGAWAVSERAERLALARRVQQAPSPTEPAPAPAPTSTPVAPSEPDAPVPLVRDEPPAHSYLASHRMLDKGLDAWPAAPPLAAQALPDAPRPPVLRAWPYDEMLEP